MSKKKIVIRNPNNIRPWQHVIEPTLGYLKLAELQYKKKRLHKDSIFRLLSPLLNIFFGFPNNKIFKTKIQSTMKNNRIE